MIRRARGWRSIAVLGIAGLALAACGSDEATDTESSAPVVAETSEPEESVAESSADVAPPVNEADGTLTLGTLLPETGGLAFLGPPEVAGVQLAAAEINEAGGVLGQDVVVSESDSGDTSTDIANQSVDRLLGEGVDAIIGAASSGVTLTVIDKIAAAQVVQMSPANTSPTLTDYADDGFYFRTAPSDVLQGRVLGDLVATDGCVSVAIMALDDSYGEGLTENARLSLEASGSALALEPVVYDPEASTFSAEVTQVKAANPDCLIIIGFAETVQVIQELVAQSIGPDVLPTYFVDGNLADYSADSDPNLPPGTLTGVKGTLPGADTSDEFQARLLEVDPDLTSFAYAPESYDAAILIALAAILGGSDDGITIRDNLVAVSREGEKCTTFADCVALLDAGTDIDYDGQSGPIEFAESGDPSQATIGIYEYDDQNKNTALEFLPGSVE